MHSILIVDDDTNYQRVLRYTLHRAGYDVRVASNGEAGLTALNEKLADLIIVDLMMPFMNGITMVNLMHQNELLAHIPVIILTASGDYAERQAAEESGVNMVLTKPISSHTILGSIAEVLGILETSPNQKL